MSQNDQITIIRAPRDTEHHYMALARAVPQDSRLSFEARGLLVYLLSKPSDWTVRPADLQREGKIGRDKMYRILKELTTHGYLHRERIRKPNGTFEWGPHQIYEIPFTENTEVDAEAVQPLPEKPLPGYPYPAEPYPVNTDIYKGESSTDQRIVQNLDSTPPPQPQIETTGGGGENQKVRRSVSKGIPAHVKYLSEKNVGAAHLFADCDPAATIRLFDLMTEAGWPKGAIVADWKLNPPTPERVTLFEEQSHAANNQQRVQPDQKRAPRPGERGYTGRTDNQQHRPLRPGERGYTGRT